MISHIVENHKHGMVGISRIKVSKNLSYSLNRLDILGCVLTVLRFGYIYFKLYGLTYQTGMAQILFFTVMFYLLNIISEYDKCNVRLKRCYIFFHSLWHLGIFVFMYFFLCVMYGIN